MVQRLSNIEVGDYVVIAIHFVVTVVVGLWVSRLSVNVQIFVTSLVLEVIIFSQTWAQDTFKISSSRPSSYFYIQDKNQVLYSLKNTSSSKHLQFQESSSKNFMCQSSSSKQNENPAIQALSKKPKIFRALILLAGWI